MPGSCACWRNLVNAPALVNLIWGLDPPADLLVQYFDYFGGFLDKEIGDWKGNGSRTGQAIVLLLPLLQREGAFDLQTGRSLLAAALESFQAKDETEFLFKTSGYLTEKIIPVLRSSGNIPAGSADMLLEALAGRYPPRLFLFDGTPIVQGDVASNVMRMQSSIRPQRICPLPDILSAIRPLVDYPKTDDGLLHLAENTGKLTCASQANPVGENAPKRATAPDLTEVAGRLASALKAQRINGQAARNGPPPAIVSQLVQQISSMLNTELRVALLAYGYASCGAPQIAVLSDNANFVRNRDFLASGRYVQICHSDQSHSLRGCGCKLKHPCGPSIYIDVRNPRRIPMNKWILGVSLALLLILIAAPAAQAGGRFYFGFGFGGYGGYYYPWGGFGFSYTYSYPSYGYGYYAPYPYPYLSYPYYVRYYAPYYYAPYYRAPYYPRYRAYTLPSQPYYRYVRPVRLPAGHAPGYGAYVPRRYVRPR